MENKGKDGSKDKRSKNARYLSPVLIIGCSGSSGQGYSQNTTTDWPSERGITECK